LIGDLVGAQKQPVGALDRINRAMVRMGHAARQTYLAQFTPEQNYQQLLEIYRAATRLVGSLGR